jgi:uncharacterized protein
LLQIRLNLRYTCILEYMKIVISPAKTLDYTSKVPIENFTLPSFSLETEQLNAALRKQKPKQLSSLMEISAALAQLNFERNQIRTIEYSIENAKQAVFAFKGDVYLGLDAYSLDIALMGPMQEKLRILSGLYGLLRPLDLIQPYRLEMGTTLKVGRKPNLYKFWDNKITDALSAEMQIDEPLLNLASNEYFSVINSKRLQRAICSPVFKDFVNGKWQVVSFHAKKARGMMLRFVLENQIDKIEDLVAFDSAGYAFENAESSLYAPVFKRA